MNNKDKDIARCYNCRRTIKGTVWYQPINVKQKPDCIALCDDCHSAFQFGWAQCMKHNGIKDIYDREGEE